MPSLTDIVNDLATALAAAETAEDALTTSAGADAVYAAALQSAITRFRASFLKSKEAKTALEADLTKRTAAIQAIADGYTGKVAGVRTDVENGGRLAAAVLAGKTAPLVAGLSLVDAAALDALATPLTAADAAAETALAGKRTTLASVRTALEAARKAEGARKSELELLEARIRFFSENAGLERDAALRILADLEKDQDAAAGAAGDAKLAMNLRAAVRYLDLAAKRKRLVEAITPASAASPFDVDNADAAQTRDALMQAWNAARDAVAAAAGDSFLAEKAAFAAEMEALKAERDLAAYQGDRLSRAVAVVKDEAGL